MEGHSWATVAKVQRGPLSPDWLLCIGIRAALLVAPPYSARPPRRSITCQIKAASLPFLNENGSG